ncbi:MAG: YHYH protein [Rhodoglobus sp.]
MIETSQLRRRPGALATVLLAAATLTLTACVATETSPTNSETPAATVTEGIDLSLFVDGAIVGEPAIVDCTLSDGAVATCYEITISGDPTDHEVGPFCPSTITTSADDAGIWFDGDNLYSLDGAFIENLATTYNDTGWHMYDADGNVYVTDTAEAFAAAAQPQVDPAYQNYCIEGSFDFLDGGVPIQQTVTIPTTPVLASAAGTSNNNLGITLDGVIIAPAAPVSNILGAYTIAAFDQCGGHFNPFEGYHLHGAVGCSEVGTALEGETAMFGYAFDGFPVYSPYSDEELANVTLDECGGHTTEELGYHYHAQSAEKNLVIKCLVGQYVATDDGAPAGGPPAGGPPAGGPNG